MSVYAFRSSYDGLDISSSLQTVGALLSRAYTSGGCVLGAIFGTGTNGAYLEDVANITKFGNAPAAAEGGYMIVNTEWGGFNNSVRPWTLFNVLAHLTNASAECPPVDTLRQQA